MNEHPEPGEHHQDNLREQLRALDPAASLSPADPAGVARLLEETMTDQLTDESRADGTHHRSKLTWIVAAAATALIGGGTVFALTQGGDDQGGGSAVDQPTQSSSESQATPTVTNLTLAGGVVASKCLVPEASPEVVAAQSLVFDGTVESISDGVVTLAPTRFYTGDETDLVTVQEPSDDMAALLSAVQFEEGGRYLVSATDGQVTLCGFSAEYSDSLAAVYEQAFAG